MSQQCPVNTKTIDNTTVRINSILNSFVLLSIIVLNKYIFIAILVIDFAIKLNNPENSPITRVSQKIRDFFNVKVKMINLAPKEFAMKIGFFFSLLLLLLAIFSVSNSILFILSTLFLSFMFLEWAMDYCIGCKIYAIVQFFKNKKF